MKSMNRRQFIIAATVVSTSWWIGCTKAPSPSLSHPGGESGVDVQGYWTCTMHPQVHQDGPGKCPICGMPLVHVNSQGKKMETQEEPEGVEATNKELENIEVSKYTVGKKDLEISIPVSGRLLTSREIAFQIYESDLSSVKPGLEFTGSPTSNPGQTLTGRISSVDQFVDPTSRTVRAVGILQNNGQLPSSETGFQGEIHNILKNQIVVPEEAVLRAGTRDLVYVLGSNNKWIPRTVQLGPKGKQGYQILSGLEAGEVISSGPNFLLDSEAKIRGQ